MIESKLKIMDKLISNKENILLDSFNFYPYNKINRDILYNYWKKYLQENKNIPIKFYIHIPFCQTICNYCQYDTIKLSSKNQVDDYLEDLFNYIDYFKNLFKNVEFKWLYIWWWTPSILSINNLEKLFNYLNNNLSFSKEYYNTIELNPSSTNFKKLDIIFNGWIINRVSFWVQSFNKNTLDIENRQYSSEKYISNLVNHCKKLWFEDINLDIIFGLNYEREEDLLYNIWVLIEIKPYSITVYTILKNIEKSILHKEDKKLFYDNVEKIYLDIFNKSRILENYNYNKWSSVLWFNLYLKWINRKNTKPYEAHSEETESLFSVWYKSFWKIWWYWEYNFWIDMKEINFSKNTENEELYKYLLQAFQYELDILDINNKFNINFEDKFKKELDLLKSNDIINVIEDRVYYIWDKNYIWYWWLLFLEYKLLLLFIKNRFY